MSSATPVHPAPQHPAKRKSDCNLAAPPQPIGGAHPGAQAQAKQPKLVPSITHGVSVPHKPRVGADFQAVLPPPPPPPPPKGAR
jgi:hypothetical protein